MTSIMKGSCWYTIHNIPSFSDIDRTFCQIHRFSSYKVITEGCFCKNDLSIQNNKTLTHYTVAYHDNQGHVVGLENIEIFKNGIGYKTYEQINNRLDPNSKFIVVGAKVEPHIKVGHALFLKVMINEKEHYAFCGRFPVKKTDSLEDILDNIKQDSRCDRFDISKIGTDNIVNSITFNTIHPLFTLAFIYMFIYMLILLAIVSIINSNFIRTSTLYTTISTFITTSQIYNAINTMVIATNSFIFSPTTINVMNITKKYIIDTCDIVFNSSNYCDDFY